MPFHPASDIIPNAAMLQRVLSFIQQTLPLLLEKLSASRKKLSAWVGWARTPVVDDGVDAEAQALTKELIQQRSGANVAAVSPGTAAKGLRPSPAERPGRAKGGPSSHFSITIRANGQEHTYDTTYGISDDLASKLMDELGLPPEEFQTLVRLRQHRLQEAVEISSKKSPS